jgi:hypothetical protein
VQALELTHQCRQTRRGVLDAELIDDMPSGVDDAGRMALVRPINTSEARYGILHMPSC